MGDFVHLHLHSEYSLLDGANRIKEIPKIVKELGMDTIALTDHGVMYGTIDFYKECIANGVKPIIGCEVYVAPRDMKLKDPNLDTKYNHLILLAKDNEGYKNLIKLVSLGFTEGFYYKPRIDKKVLKEYSKGLVCLSACLAGEVPSNILNGEYEKAKEAALWYKEVFGDDYYLEIQNNGLKQQVLVNQKLIELSKEIGVELVATNDSHYSRKEDAYNHEVLLCIQTGKRITDEDRMKFETDELYIKSPEEMKDFFSNVPEAIENTLKIADKCNVTFEFGNIILPNYDVPEEYETHYDYLKHLTDEGLKRRYQDKLNEDIIKRKEYELSVIKKMGYVDYFLIVWDYVNYAKNNGIPVGPGRGSGAGSIVAYSIGITDIDPIRYGLMFERFLNPERVSMPDFDIDFDFEKRQEVIDYVSRKYGHDHVSQIITFGTMSARMVIRDVARVLDYSYAEADKIAKMIPTEKDITIKKAIEINRELKELYENDERYKRLLDIATALEGMPRQASTHACGVIISNKPVCEYVPLYARDDIISTQYTMTTLEELGLLKMDFLGLRTLTVIREAKELIKYNQNIDVVFDNDMEDPEVFKLWQNGETVGIFQFESQGMTNFMKELKPDCLEDIIAGVALYRPGPLDQISRYIKYKKNPAEVTYTHEALKPILKVTYGCMVYQEQVIQIVRDLAGFSLGRADLVRRAMGKKKPEVMKKQREIFIHGLTDENGNVEVKGCIRNGISEEDANRIFDEISDFANYAFNKSHAACYAVIAYYTAYLKKYYPAEFMAAMLNSFLGNLDKVPVYINECKRLHIPIIKPNINKSYTKFAVEDGKILFGLGSIKNVGIYAVKRIVEERQKNGEYKDFTDFCERIHDEQVNKRCIESLIRAGAFDDLGKSRATLIASYEKIIDTIASQKQKYDTNQITMFDIMSDDDETTKLEYKFNEVEEFKQNEILAMEKEMLGIYVSGHPLEKLEETIKKISNIDTIEINRARVELEETKSCDLKDGAEVKIAGLVKSLSKKYTKTNKIMCFIELEDLYGVAEILCFEDVYVKAGDLLREDSQIIVSGRLSIKEDKYVSIVANNIEELKEYKEPVYYINLDELYAKEENNKEEKEQKEENKEINKEKIKERLISTIRFFEKEDKYKNNIKIIIKKDNEEESYKTFVDKEILEEIKNISNGQ